MESVKIKFFLIISLTYWIGWCIGYVYRGRKEKRKRKLERQQDITII